LYTNLQSDGSELNHLSGFGVSLALYGVVGPLSSKADVGKRTSLAFRGIGSASLTPN
jgi:hypothetical protein